MKQAFILASLLLLICFPVSAAMRFVDLNNPNPAAPYTSWAAAATTIQAAVDAAVAGDEILVTNGVYATGGRALDGTMTNRVAVTKAVILRSVNGPQFTSIQGRQVPGTTNGDGAVRCVYLTNGASLIGFTVTGGATRISGNLFRERNAGGVYCESTDALVSNCVITANSAHRLASGVQSGTLQSCTISSNSASSYPGAAFESTMNNCELLGNAGGAAFYGTLVDCLLQNNHSVAAAVWVVLSNCTLLANSDGGASFSTLFNCRLIGNSSASAGGGAYQATLVSCLLVGNSAPSGGGAAYSVLTNCTVSGNWATIGGGVYGQTSSNGFLNNCIVYSNTATSSGDNYYQGVFRYSCTTPLPAGDGNIDLPPAFVDAVNGNFTLAAGSPGINAGNNALVVGSTDLMGSPRIGDGTVDMGAYEFQALQPSLRIAQSGESIMLAWPVWASDFGLQQAGAAPGYAGGWSNLNAIPNVTNNENTVTLPMSGELKLFRLHKP